MTAIPADADDLRDVIARAFVTLRALPNARHGYRLAETIGLAVEPRLPAGPQLSDAQLRQEPPAPRVTRLVPSACDITKCDAVFMTWLPLLRGADERIRHAVVHHAKGMTFAEIGRRLGCTGQYVGRLERRGLDLILGGLRRGTAYRAT